MANACVPINRSEHPSPSRGKDVAGEQPHIRVKPENRPKRPCVPSREYPPASGWQALRPDDLPQARGEAQLIILPSTRGVVTFAVSYVPGGDENRDTFRGGTQSEVEIAHTVRERTIQIAYDFRNRSRNNDAVAVHGITWYDSRSRRYGEFKARRVPATPSDHAAICRHVCDRILGRACKNAEPAPGSR